MKLREYRVPVVKLFGNFNAIHDFQRATCGSRLINVMSRSAVRNWTKDTSEARVQANSKHKEQETDEFRTWARIRGVCAEGLAITVSLPKELELPAFSNSVDISHHSCDLRNFIPHHHTISGVSAVSMAYLAAEAPILQNSQAW